MPAPGGLIVEDLLHSSVESREEAFWGLRFQPAHGDGLALLGKDSEPADEGQFLELDLPFLDGLHTLCDVA